MAVTGTIEERIEQIKRATGVTDDEMFERPVLEHDGYSFGERIRIVADDEQRGLYGGDMGYLILGEVGAPQYGNVRTAMHILIDEYDSLEEVTPDDIEPTDA